MGDVKVSVVIPFFNGIDYLEECVNSVCAQTLRELEIILVDDGSTGGCGELADKLAQNDERIRVIHQQNKGVSAARNAALSVAKGEYIGFVDADDIAKPDMYAILYNTAVQKKCEIVTGSYSSFDETGILGHPRLPLPVGEVLTSKQIVELLPTLSTRNTFLFIWRRLFSAELIRKNNITFDPEISVGEDSLFCLHCFLAAERVTTVADRLYLYRHRQGSAMRSQQIYKPNLLHSFDKLFSSQCALLDSYAPSMLEAFCRDFAIHTSAAYAPYLIANALKNENGRFRSFRQFCRSEIARNMRCFCKAWETHSRSLDMVIFRLIRRHMVLPAYLLSLRVFRRKCRCSH